MECSLSSGKATAYLNWSYILGLNQSDLASWRHQVAVHGRSMRLVVNGFMNPRQFITPRLIYVALGEKFIAIFLRAPNRLYLWILCGWFNPFVERCRFISVWAFDTKLLWETDDEQRNMQPPIAQAPQIPLRLSAVRRRLVEAPAVVVQGNPWL